MLHADVHKHKLAKCPTLDLFHHHSLPYPLACRFAVLLAAGICFDYLRPSGCHRGLLCRFSHDLSSIAQQCAQSTHSSGAGGDGSKAGAKSSKAICFDFVKGV